MRNTILSQPLAAAGLFSCLLPASGAIFVQPVAVDADSGALYSEAPADRVGSKAGATEYAATGTYSAEVLFDRGGLPTALNEVETIDALAEISLIDQDGQTNNHNSVWFTDPGTQTGTLVFDMGAGFTEDIASFVLWTTEFDYYRRAGVADFKLRFFESDGDQVGSEFSGTGLEDVVDDGMVAAQIFDLGVSYSGVRYVEWELLSIIDSESEKNYITGHEIGFATVPEPAQLTWLLGLMGLLCAVCTRRRAA